MEELGPQKEYEPLLCDCLLTMITFASQSTRYKNIFLQPVDVSTQSRRVTLLKLLLEHIQKITSLQSNSRLLRIEFTLLRSLSISGDVAKEIMKHRFIEDIT